MNSVAIITGLASLALGFWVGAWLRRDEARDKALQLQAAREDCEVLAETLGVEMARREQAERERDRAVQLEASTRKAAFALLGEKWRERERGVEWPPYIEVRD